MTHTSDQLQQIVDELGEIRNIITRHADVIDSVLEERNERAAFWRDVRKQLITGSVWGLVSALGYVVWYATQQYVRNPHGQ